MPNLESGSVEELPAYLHHYYSKEFGSKMLDMDLRQIKTQSISLYDSNIGKMLLSMIPSSEQILFAQEALQINITKPLDICGCPVLESKEDVGVTGDNGLDSLDLES